MSAPPPVSVVMPVRNAAPHLAAALESVLGQSLPDFELVVLDDASDDGSTELLEAWARRDRRIRLHRSPARLGVVGAANAAAGAARGEACARMDADDVAHPDRLRRQLEALRACPEVALVGTLYEGIDAAGRLVRPRDRWRLFERSPYPPFPHGSIMYRRAAFEQVGGYREACSFWEDLDLVHRLAARGRIVALADALYRYRFHLGSTQLVSPTEAFVRGIGQARRCVEGAAGGGALLDESAADLDRGHLPALVLRGALRLWGGHSPQVRGRLGWRRLGATGVSLRALLLATWGDASPGTLRAALGAVLRVRDRLGGLALRGRDRVEWRPA